MIVFNSYNHFKNYCLKIVSNKGVEIIKSHHQTFSTFETFIEFLRRLELDCKINTKENPIFKIVEEFKIYRIDEAIQL